MVTAAVAVLAMQETVALVTAAIISVLLEVVLAMPETAVVVTALLVEAVFAMQS